MQLINDLRNTVDESRHHTTHRPDTQNVMQITQLSDLFFSHFQTKHGCFVVVQNSLYWKLQYDLYVFCLGHVFFSSRNPLSAIDSCCLASCSRKKQAPKLPIIDVSQSSQKSRFVHLFSGLVPSKQQEQEPVKNSRLPVITGGKCINRLPTVIYL